MFHLKKVCLLFSFILLLLLVYIALYIKDQFVRPFLGDVLVVIWLYLFLKSFLNIRNSYLAHSVLVFSFLIEIAQFYHLVDILGLQDIKAARIILGSTFDLLDLLAYSIGWFLVLFVEFLYRK